LDLLFDFFFFVGDTDDEGNEEDDACACAEADRGVGSIKDAGTEVPRVSNSPRNALRDFLFLSLSKYNGDNVIFN
jgi:hypothetical protein